MASNEVKHDNYEPAKLNVLFQIIQNAFNAGQKQDYEIQLDNFKIVPRTSNPELFNSFSDFITENTRTVMVKMFRGGSPTSDKYYFHIQGVPQKEQELSGIPNKITEDEWESKHKAKLLKEIRYEQLEEENAELQAEVDEQEKIIEELQTRLQQLKDGKLLSIGEMGSSFLMGLLKSPMMQKNFPGLAGFTGASNNDANYSQQAPQEEASFSRKGEEAEQEGLSEEEQGYLILIRDLEKKLTPFQLSSVMHILDLITQCPASIGSTQKHLNNFLSAYTKKENQA